VVFEYEPIGAAARYAARLDRDELIVVADFGGGTTDFSVVRVGPGVAERRSPAAILATGGLGVSGDAFDARIIDALVAPAARPRQQATRPTWAATRRCRPWLYAQPPALAPRCRSCARRPTRIRLLQRVVDGAREPAKIERLTRLIDEDLGLALHRAVEGSKVALSAGDGGAAGAARADARRAGDARRASTAGSPRTWP
jgi:hypothetical chaperone protein